MYLRTLFNFQTNLKRTLAQDHKFQELLKLNNTTYELKLLEMY